MSETSLGNIHLGEVSEHAQEPPLFYYNLLVVLDNIGLYYITFLNPCLRFVFMNKKMWIGLFIAFIMVFSIFGFIIDFAIQPTTQKMEYGEYTFTSTKQGYRTKVNGNEMLFLFFPGDLEYYTLTDETKQLLQAPVYTVTYDPNSTIAPNLAEAQYYLEQQLQNIKYIERALTNNTDTTLPQKTCTDATTAQPVIELLEANVTTIVTEGTCIKVKSSDPYDLYRQTERIIYHILGVMQ